VAAVIYGSVARGDFNVWSDIDLLLVLRSLPVQPTVRLSALIGVAPPGIRIVAWTPDEFAREYHRANPIAREAWRWERCFTGRKRCGRWRRKGDAEFSVGGSSLSLPEIDAEAEDGTVKRLSRLERLASDGVADLEVQD
jgi:Nucleotidyltransferase domain